MKLRDLVSGDWPPPRWHRPHRRGRIKHDAPSWRDPAGRARLQDIVEQGACELMLVVSDELGKEWANVIELADARYRRVVSRSLSGALGRRVADVAQMTVVQPMRNPSPGQFVRKRLRYEKFVYK